jgi:nicotinate phosphoribosyltransferase
MEKKEQRLKGIRLDSGDLAYLARKSRELLDDAGLQYVKIAASNQLDEYVIRSLLEQDAPIDVFGVGTSMVTGLPDGALDGVYKLASTSDKPRIKLSETISKITLPSKKQVHRIYNGEQIAVGAECISIWEEQEVDLMFHPFEPGKFFRFSNYKTEPLLHKVMEGGNRTLPARSLEEISNYSQKRLEQLPLEYKRFENPHLYKIGISRDLKESRDKLIAMYSKKENNAGAGTY